MRHMIGIWRCRKRIINGGWSVVSLLNILTPLLWAQHLITWCPWVLRLSVGSLGWRLVLTVTSLQGLQQMKVNWYIKGWKAPRSKVCESTIFLTIFFLSVSCFALWLISPFQECDYIYDGEIFWTIICKRNKVNVN